MKNILSTRRRQPVLRNSKNGVEGYVGLRKKLLEALLLALVGCTASAMDQKNVKTVNPDVAIIVDRMVDRVVAQDFRQKVQGFIKKIKDPIADQLFSVHLIMMADKRACDSGSVTHAALIEQKQDLHAYFVYIADKFSETLADLQAADPFEQAGKNIIGDVTQRLVAASHNFTTHDSGADNVVQLYKELEELLKEVSSNLSVDHALLRAIPAEIARQEQERRAQQEAHEAQLARQEQFRKKYEKIYYAQLPDEQLEEVRNEEIRNIARDQRSANKIAMQKIVQEDQDRARIEAAVQESRQNHERSLAATQKQQDKIAAQAALAQQKEQELQRAQEALKAQQKAAQEADEKEREAARLKREAAANSVDASQELNTFLNDSDALTTGRVRINDAVIKSRLDLARDAMQNLKLFENLGQEHKNSLSAMKANYKNMQKIIKKMENGKAKKDENDKIDGMFAVLARGSEQFLTTMCGQVLRHLAVGEQSSSQLASLSSSSSVSSPSSDQFAKIDALQELSGKLLSLHGNIKNIQFLQQLTDIMHVMLNYLPNQTRQWVQENYLKSMQQYVHDISRIATTDQPTVLGDLKIAIDAVTDATCCLGNIGIAGLLRGDSDDQIDQLMQETIKNSVREMQKMQGSSDVATNTPASDAVVHEEKQREEKTQHVDQASAAPGDPDIRMVFLQDIIRDSGTICNDGADPVTMAQQVIVLTERLILLLSQDADKNLLQRGINSVKAVRKNLRVTQSTGAGNSTFNISVLNVNLFNAALALNGIIVKQADRQLRALRKMSSGRQAQMAGLKGIMGKLLKYHNKCFDIPCLRELRQHGQSLTDFLQGTSKEWFVSYLAGMDRRIDTAVAAASDDNAVKEDIKGTANAFITISNSIIRLMYGEMNIGISDEEIAASIANIVRMVTTTGPSAQSSAAVASK